MPWSREKRLAFERSPQRQERFAAAREATAWADSQIATLKALGTSHTPAEWKEIRSQFRKYKLTKNTVRSLAHPH